MALFSFAACAGAWCRELPPADPGLLESALDQAAARGVMVALVVVRAEEDGRDPRLLGLFDDPAVARALGGSIPLLVPADRQPALAARFNASRFPTLILLEHEGREAGRLSGLSSPASFAARIADIAWGSRSRTGDRPPAAAESSGSGPSPEGKARDEIAALWAKAHRSWEAGRRLEAAGLYERAAARVEAAGDPKALPPESAAVAAPVYLGLGQHLLEEGRAAQAEERYKTALALASRASPEVPSAEVFAARAALGLALAARAQGKLEEAALGLQSAVEGTDSRLAVACPERERALYLLARLEVERGDEESARAWFEHCAREFGEGKYARRAARYLAAPGKALAPGAVSPFVSSAANPSASR